MLVAQALSPANRFFLPSDLVRYLPPWAVPPPDPPAACETLPELALLDPKLNPPLRVAPPPE